MTDLGGASLDDRYATESGVVFLTGIQALVRLPMTRARLDRAAGLDTAGFISGYRGSPLGGYDQALWKAAPRLEEHHVVFKSGVNEELAATAVWGSQQVNLFGGAKYDGVFGIWYGKGPGVDRSGDAFKHANAAGSAPHGGVLALAGDDHACKSSTLPHQSEHAFIDASIPVLNPADVQDLLDFGVLGFEMSRFSGLWVAMKTISESLDSSATVAVGPERHHATIPEFEMPEGGLHIRWPDPPLDQESRLRDYKLYAALAFCRANRLDRVMLDARAARLGVVSTGKAWLDVLQALDDLGIDRERAAALGVRFYKVGMSWPLEPQGVRRFAEGLEEVLVVEEKRAIVENQLKEQLYNWQGERRPLIVGKFDERGAPLLPSSGELTPARVARALASRLRRFHVSDAIEERLAFLDRKEAALESAETGIRRAPHFCSGCPHNTSTVVPPGSRALAGIGCHYMAHWMDRNTETFTQMGGEGATWIGQAPFTETPHVFANIGDGTYYHSGLLAIRAAVASGVNVTYKVLVNDAVAMTGGQPVEGAPSVAQIAHQLAAEGVRRVAVVAEFPERHRRAELPDAASLHHRDELPALQFEFRELEGVSAIVYDQVCATEKRRRRKRGLVAEPRERVVIHPEVCEGCGDCGVQSNCLSVVPLATPLGRKRAIDQSACNRDFSCLKGFCPSFVTLHEARLRAPRPVAASASPEILPEPRLPDLERPWRILVTGIGGTGVVTVSALLGAAAHLDGRRVATLDMTGLAQKYGAVVSHVQICARPDAIKAVRIAAGGADLLLGCDSVVASGFDALGKVAPDRTALVVNEHATATAAFIADPDLAFPTRAVRRALSCAAGTAPCHFLDATDVAARLLGDSIGANLLLVGFAWQQGLVPVSRAALERAIELNGVAVEFNKRAFALGRSLAHRGVDALDPGSRDDADEPRDLEAVVADRETRLVEYQDRAYAARYRRLVERAAVAERSVTARSTVLAQCVAENYYRLLAYKDEYEVARLLSSPRFAESLEEQFEDGFRLKFHLAPPFLARTDPLSGRPVKRSFGAWVLPLLRFLAWARFVRGGRFDVFGYQAERRRERGLITDYERDVAHVLKLLDSGNHAEACALLDWPREVRGFGPVKSAALERALAHREALLDDFHNPRSRRRAA